MKQIPVDIILVTMLLMTFVLVPPVVTEGQADFQNVGVDKAYDMITDDSLPDLVILDVRYQHEYDMGHLHDAILIPSDELETRIGELEGYKNHEIIVYCRSGYRSQIASEILSNHGFTKVYNMIGGILAWIEAGYPIYTTSHHVTVNIIEEEIQLQIEPLLLHQTGCASCAQNQTCPGGSKLANITSTVLEQDEDHTVILLTHEVNGTTFEVTMTHTLLWSYNGLTDEASRTVSFVSTEIAAEDTSIGFYSLSYHVQHEEYNLTLYTNLVALDSETYNSSLTIMSYTPAGESGPTSLEFVKFNSTVTLSQHYAVLGKVAKEVGKLYEKRGDETLAQLAEGYYVMKEEAKYLSKLVEKQLQEYDKEIINSSAILMDDECGFICGTICGLVGLAACAAIAAALCGPFAWICYPPCSILWAALCGGVCSFVCSGFQYVSPCDVGCNIFCEVFSSAMCAQLGGWGGPICTILSIPLCEGICWGICG